MNFNRIMQTRNILFPHSKVERVELQSAAVTSYPTLKFRHGRAHGIVSLIHTAEHMILELKTYKLSRQEKLISLPWPSGALNDCPLEYDQLLCSPTPVIQYQSHSGA